MNTYTFNFYAVHPWALILLIPAAGLLWRTLHHGKQSAYERNILIGIFRFLTLTAVVFILAQVRLESTFPSAETVILVDHSRSMQQTDADLDADRLMEGIEDKGMRAQIIQFSEKLNESENSFEMDQREQSNLENALIQAVRKFSPEVKKHVVLISDGQQTVGDVETAAHFLRHQGVVVDAIYKNTSPNNPEAQISSLTIPEEVSLGESFPAEIMIQSNFNMNCHIVFLIDDTVLKESDEFVLEGENCFSYQLQFSQAGTKQLSVVIYPEKDMIEENNCFGGVIVLKERHSILLVDGTGQESTHLSALLNEEGLENVVCTPEEMPKSVVELCTYGAVILMNVDEQELPAYEGDMLKEYVGTYGGRLMIVGGANTFNTTDEYFGDILPVKTKAAEQNDAKPLALILLVDSSASMNRNIMDGQIVLYTPMEMARRGAIKCLSALNNDDLVGVITFSGTSNNIVDMQSPQNKDSIVDSILKMDAIDVTQYNKGFAAVLDAMESVESSYEKHVIMISDGCPDDKDYNALVSAMRNQGITLSTIAVGPYMNTEVMAGLAQLGGGTFSSAEHAKDLPFLMLSNVAKNQKDHLIDEYFTPIGSIDNVHINEMTLPPLGGYIRTTVKPDANVFLTAQGNDPLYVEQVYGKGVVGVFASDLSGQWSAQWFSTPSGRQTILSLCKNILPKTRSFSTLCFQPERIGSNCLICIPSPMYESKGCRADVRTPNGKLLAIDHFTPDEAGNLCGKISSKISGFYTVYLYQSDGHDVYTEICGYLPYSLEYNAFPKSNGHEILEQVCSITGGRLLDGGTDMGNAEMEGFTTEIDLSVWFALFAAISFFAEFTIQAIYKSKRRL